MRIPPIASECVVQGRNLSCLVLGVRGNDGDLTAGPAEVAGRSGRQAKKLRVSRTSMACSETISCLSSSKAINPRSAAGAW
jgi:hypothetical protein